MLDIGYSLSLVFEEEIPLSIIRLTIIKSPFKKTNNFYLFTIFMPSKIQPIIHAVFSQKKTAKLKLKISLVKANQDPIKNVFQTKKVFNMSDIELGLNLVTLSMLKNQDKDKITVFLTAVDSIDYQIANSRNFIRLYQVKSSYDDLYKEILEQYKIYQYDFYDTTKKLPPDDSVVLNGIYIDSNITDIQLPTYIMYTYKTHDIYTVYYFDNIDFTRKDGKKLIKPLQVGYSMDLVKVYKQILYEVKNRIDISTISPYYKQFVNTGQLIVLSKDHEISRVKIAESKSNILRISTPDNTNNAKIRFLETSRKITNVLYFERIFIPNTIFWAFDIGPFYKFKQDDKHFKQFIDIAYDFIPQGNVDLFQCSVYGDIIVYK